MQTSKVPPAVSVFSIGILCLVFAVLAFAFHVSHARGANPTSPAGLDVQVVADANTAVDVALSTAAKKRLPCYILIGASWCGPCHYVEQHYVAALQARGVYCHLDADQHREPVRRLLAAAGGVVVGPLRLPTLVVIEGGKRRVYVGKDEIRVFMERR